MQRSLFFLRFPIALLLALALSTAAQEDSLPQTKKDDGEGDAIVRRMEWFYGPRRAGAEGRMAAKRLEGLAFALAQEAGESARSPFPLPAGLGSWSCRGPASSNFGGWAFGKVAGRIPALAKDWTNNILYVGSASGGVWKSTNDGQSWTSIFDSVGTQTVGAITVDPSTPSVLWVGTGENTVYWCDEYFGIGLLRSPDGGQSWELRNGTGGTPLDLSVFCGIRVDPRDSQKLVVGGMTRNCISGSYSQGGIYTTTDGGNTWAKPLTGYATSVVRDPNNPDVLWAGLYYGGVYKSVNNGATWVQQTASGLPAGFNQGRVEIAIAPSNSDIVYALFQYNSQSGHQHAEFWQTTNGGSSWAENTFGSEACDGQCSYNMTLAVHPTLPLTVYRGTVQLFKATDGGRGGRFNPAWVNLTGSWGSSQKVHQDTHIVLVNPSNGNEFYVGCDGGLWKSTNGGTSFTNLNANLNLTQFYAVGIHPTSDDILVGGAQDNSSLARVSSDTWELQAVTGDGFIALIDPVTPNNVYITSYPYGNLPSVSRSTTGVLGSFSGVTGSGSGIGATSRIEWVTPYAHSPIVSGTLFLGTYRMYRTTNRGTNWSAVGPTDMTGGGNADIFTVNVSRTSGQYVYAGTTDSRIWQSVDGGNNWSQISTGLPARVVTDIDPDPVDGAFAFCAVSGFDTSHLYEFTGTEWVARGAGLPNVPANTVLALDADEILVGTDVGIFRSADRGQNFSSFNVGLPEGLVVTDLQYNSNTHTITAGTYGRGAWQFARIPPAEIQNLLWSAETTDTLSWNSGPDANGYRVYQGTAFTLPTLPSGATVCLAYSGPVATTGAILGPDPSPGTFFWYLAVAYNGLGEGSPGAGSSSARTIASSGNCSP